MLKRSANFNEKPEKRLKTNNNLLTNYYPVKGAKDVKKNNQEIFLLESQKPLIPPLSNLSQTQLPEVPNYLSFFLNMISEMLNYGTSVLSEEDSHQILEFKSLSNLGQKLYVRLFMRKNKWINLNTLNYPEITDIVDAANDLLSSQFAQSSKNLSFDNIEKIYEFLFSLNVELLEILESHLRNLLIEIIGDDCIDVEVEKPCYRVLLVFLRSNYYKERLGKLFEIKEDLKDTRKNTLIQLNAELITSLKSVSTPTLLKEKILPEDFPGLIQLTLSPLNLFQRLDRSFGFYSTESSIKDFASNFINSLTPANFSVSIKTHQIYTDYNDCLIMDSVYSFSLLIESLQLSNYNLTKLYSIVKQIVCLKITPSSLNLENFIINYKNPDNIDWKVEYTSSERWARLFNLCLDPIQKVKDWELALSLLLSLLNQDNYYIKRGHWWDRVIIIVNTHLGLKSEAEKLMRLALNDHFVRTGKRLKIESRLSKLETAKKRVKPEKLFDYVHPLFTELKIQAESFNINGKLRFKIDCTAVSVEDYAINHYKSQGWIGFHSENQILTSIFGILMWEFLFEPVPYVFQTSFQKAPLDFRSDGFVSRRISTYKSVFKGLKSCQSLGKAFIERYYLYYKQDSMFVDWMALEKWGIKFVEDAVDGMGNGLIKVLKALCKDYRHNSSGMPDLLLIRDGEVKLVEVKSTNDKLSDQQKMWIQLLTSSNIKTEVLHIVHHSLLSPKN